MLGIGSEGVIFNEAAQADLIEKKVRECCAGYKGEERSGEGNSRTEVQGIEPGRRRMEGSSEMQGPDGIGFCEELKGFLLLLT